MDDKQAIKHDLPVLSSFLLLIIVWLTLVESVELDWPILALIGWTAVSVAYVLADKWELPFRPGGG